MVGGVSRDVGELGHPCAVGTGEVVDQLDAGNASILVADVQAEALDGAINVEVHHMATAERASAEAEGDDDRLLLLDDLLAKINGVDLGDLIDLPRERNRRAVDGELLQGEDLWIGDSQARHWPAVPHTRLSTLCH